MFRGLQLNRSRTKSVNIILRSVRDNTNMTAADGAAGASAKTLKMENVRGLLGLQGSD